jgi:hypothetical protein
MQFDIRSNVREVSRWLDDAQQKQVPFATIYAMTLTAKDIRPAAQDVMRKVFDRPTPYALNALWVKPATKAMPIASVDFKGSSLPARRFLNPEVHGGPRSQKGYERQLLPLMRGWQYAMPGRDTPRNAYGNVSGATFKKIISQLKVSTDPLSNASQSKRSKRKRKNDAYFVSPNGDMILHRTGVSLKPALIFTKAPSYRKRFPFYETAAEVVRDRFRINFEIAFQRTMANSGYKSVRGTNWRF